MKTVNKSMSEFMLDLIFNGSWESIDDFDEQLDELAEYANSLRESINGINEQLMVC